VRTASLTVIAFASLAIGVVSASWRPVSATPPVKIEFNRDIRPILSKCMLCHGPDSGEGANGLRLDKRETALKKLADGKNAIVPGSPDASELIRRINAEDESVRMPPPETHKTLSAEEKQLLAQWIREGAEYKEHWAFVRPVRPNPPAVKNGRWVRNPIDRFVLAKLEEHGLQPEREADPATLLRRVSLDLTGLPPTPAEVDAFLSDKSPNAYEKAVDSFLASPRFGERMAMDWMDYSRYADSNGYQADYERFQSRWRDWVIRAFNENKPYDQFTVEQIAGDLIPNATTDQKLATAFNRNHRINTEGGVIAEEWRVETIVDRVETTTAVWLGLTAGCARCHDHKYDPFKQKDFYRFFAYFNNVPESGSGEERPINHPPTMKAPNAEEAAQMAQLSSQASTLDAWMTARAKLNAGKAAAWTLAQPLPEIKEGLVARIGFQPPKGTAKPGPYFLSANIGRGVFESEEAAAFKVDGEVKFEPGRATGAVVTSDKGFLDLGNLGDYERDKAFSYGAWIRPGPNGGSPISRMETNNGHRGWEISVFNNRPQAHLINNWPSNGAKIAAKQPIPVGEWTHVFVTYDGSSKAAGMKLYVNGKLADVNVENDSLKDTIKTGVSTKIGRRTTSEIFNGAVDDFALFDRELTAKEVERLASTHPATPLLAIPVKSRTPEQASELARLWSLDFDAEFRKSDGEARAAKKKRDELDASIPAVMVMQEMPKPRDCFVLIRGQYDKPGEKVEAGLPAFLPPMPANVPNNRLGLAEWIVSPENPLTARVTVNRYWERLFGHGLCDTVEDFGTRAEFPSHPELLDWLATEFVRLKWDQKAMLKTIVTSATYRQASRVTAAKLSKDPLNRFLSRGPRLRLPGEVIRDQALFAAGLLNSEIGGPSVRPVMPDGVWDETNFYGNLRNYRPAMNSERWRRSLYTIWKRTAAPPNMLLFDVPSRETCRVRRSRTDTPLQALTLLNDETYVEAARALGQRMMREGGTSPESRLAYGFKCLLSRAPTAEEMKFLLAGFDRRLAAFRREPESARKLLEVGIWPREKTLDTAELAAYTVSASTMLNLDEAVTKE